MLNSWLFIPVFLFLWIPGISKFLSRPWPSRGKSFKVRDKFITFFRWIVQKCWVLTTGNWHVKTQTFQILTEWRLLCNFEKETNFRENSSYWQSCQWSTKNRPRWFDEIFPPFFVNGKLYHFFDNNELKHILCFSRALDQVFVWMTTAILHCFKPFSKLVFAYFSDDWARVNRIILKCLKLVPKLNWKYLKLKIHEYLT